jgi:aminoglycoside phosphotransferase (APT) family kinase protein
VSGPDLFPTSMTPLEGGWSGETFLAEAAGERVVVRVYAGRSAARGPLAPEIDAAVLELVRDLLPVPPVLEVRRGDPDSDVPGLLVTGLVPGERLDLVLPRLDDDGLRRVGTAVGTVLGRLGHMTQPRAGTFADLALALHDLPGGDLPDWVAAHAERLEGHVDVGALAAVADRAQDLLDEDRRHVLVHGDLNPKNLLVDPDALEVTAVLDWEFAHAGSPWTDLGNALRLHRLPAYADAVLAAHRGLLPGAAVPGDVLDRARASDLYALVDLAAREQDNPVVSGARALLGAIAATGDLHATPHA